MSDNTDNNMTSPACDAKRGFFTLYDCGKPSQAQCSSCERQLCFEHFPQKLSRSLECEAQALTPASASEHQSSAEPASETHLDLIKAYQQRDQLLTEHKGSAIYLGTNLGQYYQAYDLRSFDIELSNISDLADSPDEVFFDS